MMFHVGQKVVCIAPHDWARDWAILPKVGHVYTVRGFDDSEGLLLEEIVNSPRLCQNTLTGEIGIGEPSFYPDRFRPVLERKTDISIFAAMLTKTPEEVDA